MAAGFGQGILTTPLQHLQALSVIANDGYMVKPHIISKIMDNENKEVNKTKIEKSDKRIVTKKTVDKIKDLMGRVISDNWATGYKYNIDGYDIIGKTGTAQIYENGRYLSTDYISSISLMYPKDNPTIIIYAAIKKPNHDHNYALTDSIKNLIHNISKYQGTFSDYEKEISSRTITLPNYQGKNVDEVINSLSDKGIGIVKIGNGQTIINQYPIKNRLITFGDKLFLLTDGEEIMMPDMTGWSRTDVRVFASLVNMEYEIEGTGYVKEQSIVPNSKIEGTLKVVLN